LCKITIAILGSNAVTKKSHRSIEEQSPPCQVHQGYGTYYTRWRYYFISSTV